MDVIRPLGKFVKPNTSESRGMLQVKQSGDFHRTFEYDGKYYRFQITKVKPNVYKLSSCLQGAKLLRGAPISEALSQSPTINEAWKVLESAIEMALRSIKSISAEELFRDLTTLADELKNGEMHFEGKLIKVNVEKMIEANYRFLAASGYRLFHVIQSIKELIQDHGDSLEKLDQLKSKYIIRETISGDLYSFTGEEEIELAYDLTLKDFICKDATNIRASIFRNRAEEEACGCGVCFVAYLNDALPTMKCEGCAKVYHEVCLSEWLEAEGNCKYLSDRILGQCLFCSHPIFCPLLNS